MNNMKYGVNIAKTRFSRKVTPPLNPNHLSRKLDTRPVETLTRPLLVFLEIVLDSAMYVQNIFSLVRMNGKLEIKLL